MLRQLLTLLAVFTGLAAACAPAQARAPGVEQVRLEAGEQLIASCVVLVGSASSQLSRVDNLASAQPRSPRCLSVVVPGVLFGPDRAHE